MVLFKREGISKISLAGENFRLWGLENVWVFNFDASLEIEIKIKVCPL